MAQLAALWCWLARHQLGRSASARLASALLTAASIGLAASASQTALAAPAGALAALAPISPVPPWSHWRGDASYAARSTGVAPAQPVERWRSEIIGGPLLLGPWHAMYQVGTAQGTIASGSDRQPWWIAPGLGCYSEKCAAIGPDGTLYTIGSPPSLSLGDTTLNAVGPDGRLRWSTVIARPTDYTQTIGDPGVTVAGRMVYVLLSPFDPFHAKGHLIAVDDTGALKWDRPFIQGSSRAPLVSPDGATIYVDRYARGLQAFNAAGTTLWERTLDGYVWSQSAVGPDGAIYLLANLVGPDGGLLDPALLAIGRDGSERWRRALNEPGAGSFDTAEFNAPAIGGDGTIYVPVPGSPQPGRDSYHDRLLALRPDGTEKWRVNCVDEPGLAGWPIVDAAGAGIYQVLTLPRTGNGDQYLCKVDASGRLLWRYRLGMWASRGSYPPSPVMDGDGVIYVRAFGALVAIAEQPLPTVTATATVTPTRTPTAKPAPPIEWGARKVEFGILPGRALTEEVTLRVAKQATGAQVRAFARSGSVAVSGLPGTLRPGVDYRVKVSMALANSRQPLEASLQLVAGGRYVGPALLLKGYAIQPTPTPVPLRITWHRSNVRESIPATGKIVELKFTATQSIEKPRIVLQARRGLVELDPASVPTRIAAGQTYTLRLKTDMAQRRPGQTEYATLTVQRDGRQVPSPISVRLTRG